MHIAIVAIHYPVASGRYAADALRRMGHEVVTIGPGTGNEIWGGQVDPQYIWTPDSPGGWEPNDAELMIVMDSALTLKRGTHTESIVVYGVDNHVRDYQDIEADHLFLAHGHGFRMSEPDVTWLPCGYDPAWFTPGQPWQERAFDGAMIGVMYPTRSELLYSVITRNPDAKIAYGTGPIYREYAEIYQNARVSLIRSAAGDVAQRVWETTAMGCLLLMDECQDAEALGLENGKNCLVYHTPAEAGDLLRWTREHPDEAEQIALAGQAWAKPGTWDARLQVIIDWHEQQQEKPARKTKQSE